MGPTDMEKKLKSQNYIEAEMINAAFEFWYTDDEHLRSPFPSYIRDMLRINATDKFIDWSQQISEEAKKDINDEILAEKFEEIIFEQALQIVLTEDEKLTIRYPFMLRIGDTVQVKDVPGNERSSTVTDRYYEKRGDTAYLKVKLKNIASGETWETEFELPE